MAGVGLYQLTVMKEGSTPMTTITGSNIQFSVPTNPLLKDKNSFAVSSFKLVCYEIYNSATAPTASGTSSSANGVSNSDGSSDATLSGLVNKAYPTGITGVAINNGGGYSTSNDTFTVDGRDATLYFSEGDEVFDDGGNLIGTINAVTSTSIELKANALVAVSDDEVLRSNASDSFDDYLSNLGRTKPYRLRVFDAERAIGQEMSTLNTNIATNDFFVVIHADNANLHHVAKITNVIASDGGTHDFIEFDPPMAADIPINTKFSIYKGPLKTRTDAVAVAYGLLNTETNFDSSGDGSDDITVNKHIEYTYVAAPNFYFYNDRLRKDDQLDHDTKYAIRRTILKSDNSEDHSVSIFTTKSEFGKFISDTGEYNHHGLLVDNLRTADEVTLTVAGQTITQDNVTAYRRYVDDNDGDATPFGLSSKTVSYDPDTTVWADFALNISRERSGKITTAFGDGPKRYLYYDDSAIKNEIIPRVMDVQFSDSITDAGSYAEIKIADTQNIMAKKIKIYDPIELKQLVSRGEITHLENSKLFGTITSQSSGDTVLVFDGLEEGQDLRTLLAFGSLFETIRINSHRYRISAIGAPSNGSQQVTISHHRASDASSFSSGGLQENLTSAVAHRRTWSKLTSTLMVDFTIDTQISYNSLPLSADIVIGSDTLSYNGVALTDFSESRINGLELTLLGNNNFRGQRVKVKYGDAKNGYVKLQDFTRSHYSTLSQGTGLTTNNMVQGYFPVDVMTNIAGVTTYQSAVNLTDTSLKTPSLLDYFSGGFVVEKTIFKGKVETLEEKTEFGGSQILNITGRSDISKLLNPVLNKGFKFSEDWVYSTLSPYQEITDSTKNTAETVEIGEVAIDASASGILTGDIIFNSSGRFMGVCGDSGSTFKLEDGSLSYSGNSKDIFKSTYNLLDSNITGSSASSSSNHILFGKAITSNPLLINTPTPLKGVSDKGFFFTGGNRLTFKITSELLDSTEGSTLIGTSSSSDGRARGYFLDEIRDVGDLDIGFYAKARDEGIHTINSLSHYTVVNIESGEGEVAIELAPNCPAILARVDRNANDIRFETVTVTTTQIDAASDDDSSQTFFDGTTYAVGHRNSITVDTGSPNVNIGEGNPVYKSDGTFVGIIWKILAVTGATTPSEWQVLFYSALPVSLTENEQLYVCNTKYTHGMYFINTQGLNDGGLLMHVHPSLGNSRKPIRFTGNFTTAYKSITPTIENKSTSDRYGEPIYRYIDLQRGTKGGLRRTTNNRVTGQKHLEYKVQSGNIHAYAPAFKAKQGIVGTFHQPVPITKDSKSDDFNGGGIGRPESRGVGPAHGSNTLDESIKNKGYSHFSRIAKIAAVSGNAWAIDAATGTGFGDGASHGASVTNIYGKVDNWRWGNPLEKLKNIVERLDPKTISYHLFSPCDLFPESMSRPNHLGYAARDLTDYNLVLHDRGAYRRSDVLHESYAGSLSSHEMTDESFETVPITSSSITGDQIKRFGLMRLIELTFDWHFNVIDAENPPEDDTSIDGDDEYQFFPSRAMNTYTPAGSYKITSWDSITVANVQKYTSGSWGTPNEATIDADFANQTNEAGAGILYTETGDLIGYVGSSGSASSADGKLTITGGGSPVTQFPTGSDSLYTGVVFQFRHIKTNINQGKFSNVLRGVGEADSTVATSTSKYHQLKGAVFSGRYFGGANYDDNAKDTTLNFSTASGSIGFAKTGDNATTIQSEFATGSFTGNPASTGSGVITNISINTSNLAVGDYVFSSEVSGAIASIDASDEITLDVNNTGTTAGQTIFYVRDDNLALLRLPPVFDNISGTWTGNPFLFEDPDSVYATQTHHAQGDMFFTSRVMYYLSQGLHIYRGTKAVVLDRFSIEDTTSETLSKGMVFPVSDMFYKHYQSGSSNQHVELFLKMSSKKFQSNASDATEYPTTGPYIQFANKNSNGVVNTNVTTENAANNVGDGAKVVFKPLLHLNQGGYSSDTPVQNEFCVIDFGEDDGDDILPSGYSTSANTGSVGKITITLDGSTGDADENSWLLFSPNLTGYYLVSTEGYDQDGNRNSNDNAAYPTGTWSNGTANADNAHLPFLASPEGLIPKHIMHVISHEIVLGNESDGDAGTAGNDGTPYNTTQKHILIVDNLNTSSTFISNYYMIMRPAETCIYPNTPHNKIDLYKCSSKYTKQAYSDEMYSTTAHINIWNGENVGGFKNRIGFNEAVQSMYVLVNTDSTSSDIQLVPRGVENIANTGSTYGTSSPTFNYYSTLFGKDKRFEDGISYDVLLNDGDVNERKQMGVSVSAIANELKCRLNFGSKFSNKMAGIVSVGEIFTVKTPLPSKIRNPVKANIASTVTIASEAEDIVKNIMKTHDIDFTETALEYPYFTGPEFNGTDLYNSIKYLLDFKDKRLIVKPSGITLRPDTSDLDYSPIRISEKDSTVQVIDVHKEDSRYDFYNEIIVYGRDVKSIRRLNRSVKEIGRKTLEHVDETIVTQTEADSKALKLLNLHSKSTFRITVKIPITNVELLRVGDIITMHFPNKNIPNGEYLIFEIRYNNMGIMELEVGAYNKGLTDSIAELMVKNKKTLSFLRSTRFKAVDESSNFFDTVKIRDIKLTVSKTGVFGTPFTIGFNYAVNVASNSVGFNPSLGSVGTEIILEEELV